MILIFGEPKTSSFAPGICRVFIVVQVPVVEPRFKVFVVILVAFVVFVVELEKFPNCLQTIFK